MSNIDPNTSTAYANLDWENYIASRPPWPQSLRNVICDYHRAHKDAGWKRVVDVGGGVGISSTIFASDFDTIHLLDPSPRNHKAAKKFLGDWIESNGLNTKLDYTVATAEEGYKSVKDADLVICAETAHFIDPDSLVESAAAMLRPGGTMAIYSYWMPLFPDKSPRLSELFTQASARSVALALESGNDEVIQQGRKVLARIAAGTGPIASVPAPKEYFQGVRRIRINTQAEITVEAFMRHHPLDFDQIPSRVDAQDIEYMYETGKDPQADGWSFPIDNKWAHNWMATYPPSDLKLSKEDYEAMYGDWDKAFAEECPSGTVQSLWPVNILLATRK